MRKRTVEVIALLVFAFYNPFKRTLWTVEGRVHPVGVYGDILDWETPEKGNNPYYVWHWAWTPEDGLEIE